MAANSPQKEPVAGQAVPAQNADVFMGPIEEHCRDAAMQLPDNITERLNAAFKTESSFASFTDNVFVMALLMLLVLRYVRQGDVPKDLNLNNTAQIMQQLGIKDMMETTVVDKLERELEAVNMTMPTWMYERLKKQLEKRNKGLQPL